MKRIRDDNGTIARGRTWESAARKLWDKFVPAEFEISVRAPLSGRWITAETAEHLGELLERFYWGKETLDVGDEIAVEFPTGL